MAISKIWNTDGSGDWNDASNWTPATVPTPGDGVTLPGFMSPTAYAVTLSGAAGTAGSLTISGATATLDITSDTLTVSTGLDNSGTLSLANAELFAGIITNEQSGTVRLLGAAGPGNVISAATSFINNGQLISSGTLSTTNQNTVAAAFTNASTGTILVASKALDFTGGFADSGSVTILGELDLDGGASTIAGTVSGDGLLAIASGTVTFVSGASVSVDHLDLASGSATIDTALTYAGSYDQSGGTLDLASGEALILTNGTGDTLGGGTIDGSGVLLNRGVLAVTGASTTIAGSVLLRNGAGGTINQQVDLLLADSATIQNHTGGVYDLSSTISGSGTGASVVNGGTFTGDNGHINLAFVNTSTGTLIADNLYFTAGLSDSGSVSVIGAGSLYLDGGTSTLSGSVDFSNDAGLYLDGGTITIAGTLSGDASAINIEDGANVTVDPGASITTGRFDLYGGTATIATALTLDSGYIQDGAALSITSGAALILSGTDNVLYSTSTITGDGVLLNRGVLDLLDDGPETAITLASGLLRNGAGGTIVQNGNLVLVGAATIENHTGALYQFDSTISGSGTGASVVNGGLFSVANSSSIDVLLVNESSGTLTMASSATLVATAGFDDSGSVTIGSDATLALDGGASTIAGVISSGSSNGIFEIDSGDVTFVSGANFAAHLFYFGSGTATIDSVLTIADASSYVQLGGTLDLASGGALILDGTTNNSTLAGGTVTGSGVLLNQGTLNIGVGGTITAAGSVILRNGAGGTIDQETSTLTLANSATVENHVGGVYNLESGTIAESGAGASFINGGSFISRGSSLIAAPFTNKSTGTLAVATDTLTITGGFADSGSVSISALASLALDGGTSTIAGLVAGSGTLGIVDGNATFVAGASLSGAGLFVSNGSGGHPTATIATDLTLTGSYGQYYGALDITSGATLVLSNTTSNQFGSGLITDDGLVVNKGTLAIGYGIGDTIPNLVINGSGTLMNQSTTDIAAGEISGSLTLDNGASGTINQIGDLILAGTATIENQGSYVLDGSLTESGTGASFVNDGRFVAAFSGRENISATTLTNSGTLTALSGTLFLSSLASDSLITNTGTLLADGGNLGIEGNLSGTGTDQISGAATLIFGATVASTQAVTFLSGSSGTLDLGQAQSFAGTVAGLTATNRIDLANFAFSGMPTLSITGSSSTGGTYGHGSVDVTVTDGAQSVTLDLLNQTANQYSTSSSGYRLVSDGSNHPGTLFELAAT